MINGKWTFDGISDAVCSGQTFPDAISSHYTWDPNTLAGTEQITIRSRACSQPAGTQLTNVIQLRQAP